MLRLKSKLFIKQEFDQYEFLNKQVFNNLSKNNLSRNNLTPTGHIQAPSISPYEQKIRQAIQIRYKKSQIKHFKYKIITTQKNLDKNSESNSQTESDDINQTSEPQSTQLQQMRPFLYLKNNQYMNINEYHLQRQNQVTELRQSKSSKHTKKLRIHYFRSKEKGNNGSEISYQLDNERGDVNLGSKNKTPSERKKKFNLNLNQRRQIHDGRQEVGKSNQNQSRARKSLTSREIKGYKAIKRDMQIIQVKNSQNTQTLSKYNIKDTFKLKRPNQLLDNTGFNSSGRINTLTKVLNHQQKGQQSTKNKNRRFLLKNTRKQLLNQTQIPEKLQRQNQAQMNNVQNKKTQNFSLRHIQTEVSQIHHHQKECFQRQGKVQQKSKGKRNLNHTKMDLFLHNLKEKSQQNVHSSSEPKWKLQEISFRFKPVQGSKAELQSNEIDTFMQKKQKPLSKIEFSVQKAYHKLLSGQKQRKQTRNLSPAQIYTRTTNEQRNLQLQMIGKATQRSPTNTKEPNKGRRKLRIRTQTQESNKFETGDLRRYTKQLQTNQPQRTSKIPSIQIVQNLQKNQMRTTFKKQKINRFSTIN